MTWTSGDTWLVVAALATIAVIANPEQHAVLRSSDDRLRRRDYREVMEV